MTLDDEIIAKRKEIRTDGYATSIGELISLYESKEIDIHPEFQRFFRWSESQKTGLIESILLGIPIPPIFVSQRADGVWDVVDGMQRLSTIYQFIGILRDENGNSAPSLVLEGTKYLPSLKGKRWEKVGEEDDSALPSDARLILKRAKIQVSIILRESDDTAKYDLFQRLNTGGSQLSPQEVRNCILVMLNPKLYTWLRGLADFEPFKSCIALSESALQEAYDVELVLRFVIFAHINLEELKKLGDVGVFLTDAMRDIAVSKTFDTKSFEDNFKKIFETLDRTVGQDAFKRYDIVKKKHAGGFLLSQYEVVALGLGFNVANPINDGKIPEVIASIWKNRDYTDWAGSGITATRRLPRLIPFGRKLFAK